MSGSDLWSTRHLNGLEDWTKCGLSKWGRVHDHPPHNVLSVEEINGRLWARSDIVDPTVDSDSGRQRSRAECVRKGLLNCSGKFVETHRRLFYGVNLLLPEDFHVTEGTGEWSYGCSLIQFKEPDPSHWSGGLRVRIASQTFSIQFRRWDRTLNDGKGGWVQDVYSRDIPFIIGREFPVIFEIDSVELGVFRCWLDDLTAPVVDESLDCRLHPDGEANGFKSRQLNVGIYCGLNQNLPDGKHINFTDAIVTDTLDKARNFLQTNGGETVGKVINTAEEPRTFNLVNREVITLQPGEEHEVPGLPGDIELK